MTVLRLAVVSDVHAGSAEDGDTYATIQPPKHPKHEDPLTDLAAFVELHSLKVDHVICPGDMANRANDTGKSYAWSKINQIAKIMGATRVIATPGNHDLTTHEPSPDPAAMLKTLTPSYPTGDRDVDARFWASGFAIEDYADYRLAILNSCIDFPAYPPAGSSDEVLREYSAALDRGAFPESVQVELEEAIDALDEKKVNILVVHHHPLEHESHHLFKDSYGPMRRGEDLIRVLDNGHHSGRWFVIHGHKHVPRLIASVGSSANAPLLLGSASLAGKLWHPVVTVTRNQFHLVEFELDNARGLAPMRGTIESYMWGFGAGWMTSGRQNSGLPPKCGFGSVNDHRSLADSVAKYLADRALEFESWTEIVRELPALRFQGPRDFDLVEGYLEQQDIVLTRDHSENPVQVSRKVGQA